MCDKLPTNEEIIDELTNNLEANLSTNSEDKAHNSSDIQNDESSKISKTGDSLNDDPSKSSQILADFENSDNESDKDEFKDDFVDEERLKDLEVTLTEEEKESRHQRALELKQEGNKLFKETNYLGSINSYTEALRLCPLQYSSDRSIFYANRAASKVKLDRKESAIDDCSKALELNDKYVKAYERRAKLYEETSKLDESLADYKKILEIDPYHKDALQAQHRLPPMIEERNEKLKTEMLGKLKDLGNMFLRPFGLSTNNFELNQDPNSGGYSINFKQNPR